MAYIQPNSTVEFFTDIGISANYDDTIYFRSEAYKDSYFSGLSKITTVSNISYIRENRGIIRVERPMSTMYNVGYMRYRNTNFENKWFYAFVKSVNYINNITTEVVFEMDVIMTWMGAFQLKQCFIERQHTPTDAIGANITPEDIALGDYVCEGSSMTAFFGEYKVGFYKIFNPDKDSVGIAGVSQGTCLPLLVDFYPLNSSGIQAIDERLNGTDGLVKNNRIDELLGMKLVPEHWCDIQDSTPPIDTFSVTKPYTTIAGYTPKNKKLFTFPYKYLEVENCEGENVAYKYEYFNTLPASASSGEAFFQIMGTSCTPEVNIMCTPKDYNGEQYAWDDSISMKNFPNIAWVADLYKAYIAQRDSTIFGNTLTKSISGMATGALTGAKLGGSIGALAGAATGTLGGAASALMPAITDTVNEMINRDYELPSRFPAGLKGNVDSNLMVQSVNKNFYFRRMCITAPMAQIIDHYFDMFGYAIKQHGIPNMNARRFYTFVKTKGCVVHGNLPTDDARHIENIFDHGIRFWNESHVNIGNYNVNNAPS